MKEVKKVFSLGSRIGQKIRQVSLEIIGTELPR